MAEVQTRKRAKVRSSRRSKAKRVDFTKVDTGARVAYFLLFLLIAGITIWGVMKYRG